MEEKEDEARWKKNEEQFIKQHLDYYSLYGAHQPLSADLNLIEDFDKRLKYLNGEIIKHYGNHSMEALTGISEIYRIVTNIKEHSQDRGLIEDIKKELNKAPDKLYFVSMVFDVMGWPGEFVRVEFNQLRHNTPSTTKPENLMLSAERIILLHRLLIDDGIIEQINTGDFIKCFDINNKPLIRPEVMDRMKPAYVCFLSVIPGMKESIAITHFNLKGYDKAKNLIYTDEMISTKHEKLYKKCIDLVEKDIRTTIYT
jgi:hypothetical protein